MSRSESPCLSICIARLKATASAEHFAIWVLKAPYPGGYVHHDCMWPADLSQTWYAWQQLFSLESIPLPVAATQPTAVIPAIPLASAGQATSYSARLMQQLGLSLWQWLFAGVIQNSFAQSRGIAIGQDKPLRLRLEIRDPELIALPWEIMQPQAGQSAISLNQQLLFSRTVSDVDPLPNRNPAQSLNILLVLGEDALASVGGQQNRLQLQQEAAALAQILEQCPQADITGEDTFSAPCQVDTLIQPTPAELIERLENGNYNIFFYAGHGMPAPAGGQLLLRPGTTLSGTELAQVLVSRRVTLAVFNACWGAQSDRYNHAPSPRSSLAEVLIHHGVPAVLAMRDSIADQEALSFIQAFAQALAERMPVDRAAAVARQQLLTLYKFNQPAWTLPVLYMHPEFHGELIEPVDEVCTELPKNSTTWIGQSMPGAFLRAVGTLDKVWPIRGGLMRVGRLWENDLVIQERWVSQRHAEIFCRDTASNGYPSPTYFLRDFSRYGTLILLPAGWQKIHHQEVPLQSGVQLKFGSSQGQTWDFVIDSPQSSIQT
ncbi:MAG: CHAT domain-containing protein [Microcoleus vaginatus WJT46-NPBG5]|nr:CHAT domain-containing protein [Microcoleus vaginatus WJT46-NPBG5]